MQVYPLHVFVCDLQKPEGIPCCSAHGSAAVIDALRAQIAARKLFDRVQLTVTGSLGLCARGPNMVIYPEGVWYSGVRPEDVPEIVESHFIQGKPVERLVNYDPAAVREEICENRDHYLAYLRAKDASGALPDPLAQTIRAFQESRAVLTAVELDVFTVVEAGATASDAAAKIGADARATELLLNALVAAGLLQKDGDLFRNTPIAARHLSAHGKDDNRAAIMHTAHLWNTWSTLTDSVRRGTAAPLKDMEERGDQWTVPFIAAMHRNATDRASAVVHAVGVANARRMLDVGGGSGAYAIAFAQANPQLFVDVLDLETVLPIADGHIEQAGLSHRVRTRAGDLRTEQLGCDYDVVFVSAICHMLDETGNRDLLRRCYEALAPNGRVVVQDFILEADKTSPKTAALFSLNMLVGTRAGRSYSEPEYAGWMEAAGFADVHRVRLPGPAGLMIGTRK